MKISEHDIPPKEGESNATQRVLGKIYPVAGIIRVEWKIKKSTEAKTMPCTVVMDDYAPWDIVAGQPYVHESALATHHVRPRLRRKRHKTSPGSV